MQESKHDLQNFSKNHHTEQSDKTFSRKSVKTITKIYIGQNYQYNLFVRAIGQNCMLEILNRIVSQKNL